MRKKTTQLLLLALCLFILVGRSYSTTVTWAMTNATQLTPSSSSGTGFTAANQTYSITAPLTIDYTTKAKAKDNATFVQAIKGTYLTATSSLPTSYDANTYIEYSITAAAGYNLTFGATGISMDLSAAGSTSNGRAEIYYSTLAAFATPAKLNATTISLQNNTSSPYAATYAYSPSITLSSGNTLRVRIFPYLSTVGTGKYLSCSNFIFTFTAASAGTTPPTLTAASSPTTDAPFDVTFTDDGTWQSSITGITVGGTTLAAGAYDKTVANKITFTPSASTLLQSSGSKVIAIQANTYAPATVTQAIGAGAATKLGMKTQPAAPATNGAALATQPAVYIQDQYGNTTTSTAAVSAAVGSGSWTLGGTNSVNASAGTATFSGLTATSFAAVTGTTVNFASSGLTGVSSGTFNIPVPVPPTITAASSPTVDAPFTVTFTDNPSWRGAISGITVGGSSLPSAAYDITTAGQITFTPSQSALLQSSGSKSIVISSTGYSTNSFTQAIGVGAAAKLAVTTQPTAPASNGAVLATQPVVAIQDQYGNTTISTADIQAVIGSGAWTIGGTTTKTASAGSSTFTDLTATSAAAVLSATITFTSGLLTPATSTAFAIPAPPGLPAPTLTAASGATVDGAFDVTFSPDDATWRGAISGITVNGTALSNSAYNITNSGKITFTPSADALLQTSGSKTIVISAPGYNDASISQSIGVGVAAQLVMKTQPTAPATNGAVLATQPEVYVKDQYGNLTSGTVSANVTGSQAWSLGGTNSQAASAGIATFSGLIAGTTGKVAFSNATITFSCGSLTVPSGSFNIVAYQSAGTDYFATTQTGDWGSNSTWVSSPDNSNWYAATTTPGVTATSVTVAHNITMNSNTTVGNVTINSSTSLTIGSSAVLTFTAAKTFTVNGTLENTNPLKTSIVNAGTVLFNSGSAYKLSANLSTTTNCSGIVPTATWNLASTLLITGLTTNVTAITGIGQTFGNVTYNCPNQASAVGFTLGGAANLIINGTFSIINTGLGILQLTSSGNTVNLVAGSYNQTGGTVYINNNAGSNGARILTVGDFNIDNTAGTSTFYFANAASGKTTTGVLFISKSMTVGSGANVYQTVASPPGTNTACIHFNGASAQTITINGTLNGVINDSIQNTYGVNLNTNYNVNNITFSSGDLTTGSNTLNITGASSGSGNIVTSTSGTVIYGGASAQTISNFKNNAANNITINNAAGVSLSGNATVNGTLTLISGNLTVGANTLTLAGAPIAGTATNLVGGATSSIVIGGSTSGVNIPSSVSSLNNLTLNNTNGTTLQADLNLGGTLTLTSGQLNKNGFALTLGTAATIATVAGSLSAAPTFPASVNLTYSGTSTKGNEFPATDIISSLTVNNTAGIALANNYNIPTLSIGSGSSVSLPAGQQLTVGTSLTNNGTINLGSGPSGTATILTPATIGGSGSATVQQYLPQGRNWYVGVPVTSGSATALTAAGLGTSVSYWNETAGAWVNNYSGTLTRGIGYIAVSAPADGSATNNTSFSGALNTGDVSVAVSRTVGVTKEGFNLIANPYPSYLNAMTAINASAKMESTVWYRTKGTSYEFETVNTTSGEGTNVSNTGTVTGYIPPMQAFWVRVKPNSVDPLLGNSETLTFTNAMRYHANPTIGQTTITTTVMKAPSASKSVNSKLRLVVSNGVNSDETLIYTNDNAANGYDAFDSQKMTNGNVTIPEIYTLAGNNELVINGMNAFALNAEIPLGFRPGKVADFSIKATEFSNFGSDVRVFLKDANTSAEADITEAAYSFSTTDAVATTNRFSIVLRSQGTSTGIQNQGNSKDFTISTSVNNEITILCAGTMTSGSSVAVYTAIGQKIMSKQLTSNVTALNNRLTSGVYFVTVSNGGKCSTQKMIVE